MLVESAEGLCEMVDRVMDFPFSFSFPKLFFRVTDDRAKLGVMNLKGFLSIWFMK